MSKSFRVLLSCCLAYTSATVFGQNSCEVLTSADSRGLSCTDTSAAFEYFHDEFNLADSMHFRPDIRPTVEKWIGLNFIVVQQSVSNPQNFSTTGTGCHGRTDEEFLDSLIIAANKIFSTIEAPSDVVPGYSGSTYIAG